jgi:hypothetical protein
MTASADRQCCKAVCTCVIAVVQAVQLQSDVTHMPDMHGMDGRNNVVCHWLSEVH